MDLAISRARDDSISASSALLPLDVDKELNYEITERPHVDLAISRTKGGSISTPSAVLPSDIDKNLEWETTEIPTWTSR